jgi:hypothetical protein
VIEAQEIDQKRVQDEHRTVQQGREETLRHFKENQISREAELRKEMGSIKAAARAGSVISTAAPSVVGEIGTSGARETGDALTDRALMMCWDKTTREQTDSPAPSSIGKVPSEKPDSLNFSSSFSRSVFEVDCKLFEDAGQRCCADTTKCDCHAYTGDRDNQEYFRALRLRKEVEEEMLDADMWSKRIEKLDDPSATEPETMTGYSMETKYRPSKRWMMRTSRSRSKMRRFNNP